MSIEIIKENDRYSVYLYSNSGVIAEGCVAYQTSHSEVWEVLSDWNFSDLEIITAFKNAVELF